MSTELIEWVVSLGYTYAGMCDCMAKKKMYTNGSDTQFWITLDGQQVQIRRNFGGGRDTKIIKVADLTNYKRIYEEYLESRKYGN